jgi:hypothetical protein
MMILLLTIAVTEGCAAKMRLGPRPRGWTRPEKRTTDQGRFLTSAGKVVDLSGFTVAGTAPEFRRLPFEPPPSGFTRWAAP